ncbi:putative gibberellin regulated protein [Helianthus annuus]|nr:putative gibberellin regulated protein [Helianthus annuus]
MCYVGNTILDLLLYIKHNTTPSIFTSLHLPSMKSPPFALAALVLVAAAYVMHGTGSFATRIVLPYPSPPPPAPICPPTPVIPLPPPAAPICPPTPAPQPPTPTPTTPPPTPIITPSPAPTPNLYPPPVIPPSPQTPNCSPPPLVPPTPPCTPKAPSYPTPPTPANPSPPNAYPLTPPPADFKGCFSSCGLRCVLHSNQDRYRDCMACCNRCNCVPPGQYGNKEIYGSCFTDMKTQAGRPMYP